MPVGEEGIVYVYYPQSYVYVSFLKVSGLDITDRMCRSSSALDYATT